MPRIPHAALAALAVAILSPVASAGLRLDWFDTYGFTAPRPDAARDVVTDAAGNIYVTGESAVATQVHDVVTVKYSADGTREWVRHYDGAGAANDEGRRIGLDAAGNVYVGAISWGGGNFGTGPKYDIVVLRYSPAGVLEWEHRFNSAYNNDDFLADMEVMPDGSVYTVGWSYTPSGQAPDADYVVNRVSPTGHLDWSRFYDGPEQTIDWLSATLDADASGVCIAASVEVLTTNGDQSIYGAAKFAPDGTDVWHSSWMPPLVPFGFPDLNIVFDSTLDTAGSFVVVGRADDGTTSDSPADAYVVTFDAAGQVAWSVANRTLRSDEFERVTVDDQGNVFAVGAFNVEDAGTLHANHVTAAYAADGTFLWEHRFAGDGPWFDGEGFARINGAGELVVATRNIMDATGEDMKVFVYDRATGALHDDLSFDSSCCDWVKAMTIDANDNVIMAGSSRPDGSNRELIVVRLTGDGPLPLPGDVTGDGLVNVDDIVMIVLGWGPCPPGGGGCPGDADGDGDRDVDDIVLVVVNWTG